MKINRCFLQQKLCSFIGEYRTRGGQGRIGEDKEAKADKEAVENGGGREIAKHRAN